MKKIFLAAIAVFFYAALRLAQKKDSYTESIKAYQKIYGDSHALCREKIKKHFRFFPISNNYNVTATLKG